MLCHTLQEPHRAPTGLLPACTAPTPPKISSFTPRTASPCVFVQRGPSTTAPKPQVGPQAVPGGVNSVIRGMATDRGGIQWPLILSSFILARLSRQLPRSFSCEACSKSSRRQHQTEDAGRGPKRGGRSGSPSQKARLTGHFSLRPTETWIVPATPSQAACSTEPSQPRQRCCGSHPVPVPLLTLPLGTRLLLSPPFHPERHRQGFVRRGRAGNPRPPLLVHNLAINWLENCLSRQKPVLGATGAADAAAHTAQAINTLCQTGPWVLPSHKITQLTARRRGSDCQESLQGSEDKCVMRRGKTARQQPSACSIP